MKYNLTRHEHGITTCLGEYSTFERARRILCGIQAKWRRIADAEPERRLVFSIKSDGIAKTEWRVSQKYYQGQKTLSIYSITQETNCEDSVVGKRL